LYEIQPWSNTQVVGADGIVTGLIRITVVGECDLELIQHVEFGEACGCCLCSIGDTNAGEAFTNINQSTP
jgi:hypothetical protein